MSDDVERERARYEALAALVDNYRRERDEARAELNRFTAWHPHSAVGALRLIEAERERDEARDTIVALTTAMAEKDLEIVAITAALDERDLEAERGLEQYDRLTSERDEALTEIAEWKRVTGYDDTETLDFECGRAGIRTHIDVNSRLRETANRERAEARAEAKELREVLTLAGERLKACSYELTEFSYQEMASVLFDLPCNTEEPTDG